MTKQEYIEDLNEAIKILEQNHPDIKRNLDLTLYKDTIKKAYETNDIRKENLFLQISKIYALINDAHTSIRDNDCDKLKIKLLYDENKLYIINHKYNYNFIFEEIKKINDLDIKVIIEKIMPLLPKENNEQIKCNIEALLTNNSTLKGLKIVKDDVIIETPSGKYTLDHSKESDNWYVSTVYNECKWLDYNNYIFKYGICGPDRLSVNLLIDSFISDIEKKIPERIIIDLRGNVGGNSLLIKPLINYLKEYITQYTVKIVCLIDKKIFSSGIFAAVDLKALGAIFIGEKTSATINHFGFPKRHKLKNSRYNINVSQTEWIYENGIYKEANISNNIETSKKREQINPHIKISNTIIDLKNNQDKVLEISTKI